MKLSYQYNAENPKVHDLAEGFVIRLLDADLTYTEIAEVLLSVREMLNHTRPVSAD